MTEWFLSQDGRWWGMREERSVYSKDLIKTHHGMSYSDSRDGERGVCVCLLQLWIISTLFLLWPTWSLQRGGWESEPTWTQVLFSSQGCLRASPYAKPYVNFKFAIPDRDNLGHGRISHFPLNTQSVWKHTAQSLLTVKMFSSSSHLLTSRPHDVDLYGL